MQGSKNSKQFTAEPGYNDIVLYDTLSISSDILFYNSFLAVNRNIIGS
jgi:hypothetical protein